MRSAVAQRSPSLFKGPRSLVANGDKELLARDWRGTWWGLGGGLNVARTNCHDGTEQAGMCLQRTTIGRRLWKVGYTRLYNYPPPALLVGYCHDILTTRDL